MVDVTDRHFRMFVRCISPTPVLWTEMVWAHAVQDAHALEPLIGFSDLEHPIVLQLGGSDPELLATAAHHGVQRGYDAINLNCGCPAAERGSVQRLFGARLMLDPERVAACCDAIRLRVGERIPLSVKCRLGVDDRDSYEDLASFVRIVATGGGVGHFVIHARKALTTLNALRNLAVPPLRHEWVYRLVVDFPHLRFTLNGGVSTISEASTLLAAGVHGVMIGRRVSTDPFLLATAGMLTRPGAAPPVSANGTVSRREVLEAYMGYARGAQLANHGGGHPETLARRLLAPLSGIFHNTPSGKSWRRALTAVVGQRPTLREVPIDQIVRRCLEACCVSDALLDARPSLELTQGASTSTTASCTAPCG